MKHSPDNTELPYATIVVSGADAFEFLQGQLSHDLRLLEQRTQLLAAWCNPKGRVICLVRVAMSDDSITVTLPAELAEDVVRRLTMFRFRSKVDFVIRSATLAELGTDTAVADWLKTNLEAGIPEIWRDQSEQFTPHMLNLDLLDAISLDKGCYTGQEIIARTHYRGATKRRLLRFSGSGPVSPGDKVADGERNVGEVVNAIGGDLLAVVPLKSADAALTINGAKIEKQPLAYLQ